METKSAEQRAMDHLKSGNHCAESIAKTVLSRFVGEVDQHVFQIASAFGGGIGLTHEETCGALTGGVIALGYLAGRTDPREPLKDVTILVQGFKDLFEQRFGSTSCPAIIQGFGPERHMEGCINLITATAGILEEFMLENGIAPPDENTTVSIETAEPAGEEGHYAPAVTSCCGG